MFSPPIILPRERKMERVVSVCVTRGERTQWKKVEDRPGDPDGFLGEARHQSRQGTAFQIRMSGTAAL